MDFILSVYFGLNIKIEPSGLAKKKTKKPPFKLFKHALSFYKVYF